MVSIWTPLSNMGNEFYSPGEKRAAQVNRLFATIATRYDLINDVQSFGLHRWWKQQLVHLAEVQPGEQALDLCCGTGDIAFSLAKHGAQVTGMDFSEPMLKIAETRSDQARVAPENPKFIRGDAQDTSLPDASFDIVTVGYGLRNLANIETGLREMIRVLKPGGRLLILDFGKPDNPLWRAFYFGYLRLCVPLFGLIFCGKASAYSYILESLIHFPAQRGVEAKMRELNLVNVRVKNPLGGAMGINYGEKPAR